jgi:hypothetical protein
VRGSWAEADAYKDADVDESVEVVHRGYVDVDVGSWLDVGCCGCGWGWGEWGEVLLLSVGLISVGLNANTLSFISCVSCGYRWYRWYRKSGFNTHFWHK